MKIQTFEEIRRDVLASHQYLIAALAILVWDWLSVLPLEYQHIYCAKWTLLKICYLLSRYGVLVLSAVSTILILVPVSQDTCRRIFWIDILAVVYTVLITDVLLMIRVYAIYGRTRKCLVLLVTAFVVEAAMMSAAGAQLGPVLIPEPIAEYINLRGCLGSQWRPGGRAQLLWLLSLVPLLINTSLLLATLYQVWRIKQTTGMRLPLMERLQRGGLQYFAIISFFNLLSLYFFCQPNYVLNSFNAGGQIAASCSASCRLSLDLFNVQRSDSAYKLKPVPTARVEIGSEGTRVNERERISDGDHQAV